MKITVYIFIVLSLLYSCKEEPQQEGPEVDWSKEKSTDLNKELAEREKVNIQLFLDRHPSWKMTETGSGLYFYKYEKGQGIEANSGREAQVEFKISLLDGTMCYATEADEVEIFKIDHSTVETGVQEGIKLMKEGDRAKMIIPSHLAHGLTGDFNKIPPLTPIVVDLHVYKIDQ